MLANSEDHDQTSVASDLGLHCLPMCQKKASVNLINTESRVLHFCHCLKKKCCKCFECLLPGETLKTVMHYYLKSYVCNVTRLHRTAFLLSVDFLRFSCSGLHVVIHVTRYICDEF